MAAQSTPAMQTPHTASYCLGALLVRKGAMDMGFMNINSPRAGLVRSACKTAQSTFITYQERQAKMRQSAALTA